MWLVRLRHGTDIILFSLVYAAKKQQAFATVQPCFLLATFDFCLLAKLMFCGCKMPAFEDSVNCVKILGIHAQVEGGSLQPHP